MDNNCHKFAVRCITGEESEDAKLFESDVEEALESVFGCVLVTWERTGFGAGDMSFDDVDYDEEVQREAESDAGDSVKDMEARSFARRDLEQMRREMDDPEAEYVVPKGMDIKKIVCGKSRRG